MSSPAQQAPFFGQCRAVIVKLQRHAHYVIAFLGQLRGHDRAVHPARHGDHNPRLRGRLGKAQRVQRMFGIKGHHGLLASWGIGGSGHAGHGLPESLIEYRKIRDTLNPLFHPLLSGFAQIAAKGKETGMF